jgi:hypothetical protein
VDLGTSYGRVAHERPADILDVLGGMPLAGTIVGSITTSGTRIGKPVAKRLVAEVTLNTVDELIDRG